MSVRGEGYSHSEKHSVEFIWKINEVTSLIDLARSATENSVFIQSPDFSTSAKIKDLWFLGLRIKNDDEPLKNAWISLFLHSKNGNQKVRTKYLLFILSNRMEKRIQGFTAYNELSKNNWMHYRFFKDSKFFYGAQKFVKVDDLLAKKDQFFKNDILTVGVELVVYDDFNEFNSEKKTLNYPGLRLISDLKDLLASRHKSDVIIKVGDANFEAHKLILSARSCVFDGMFSHEMKENKENEVTIPDIKPEIFERVLEYIYTDTVDDLNSVSEELLEASNKYQLLRLKEMCEDALSKIIAVENAIELLILADLHDAAQLKKLVINFIATNLKKFKNTDEYEELEETHPLLLLAVLKKYSDVIDSE